MTTSKKPLITAEEIFPAMERLVLGAQRNIKFSLHIFSPRTKTRAKECHELSILNWCDLIKHALSRGVKIDILLNDFDPVGVAELHASVWERIELLDNALEGLDEAQKDNLRLLVAVPGGQSGLLMRTIIWPVVRSILVDRLKHHLETGRSKPPGIQATLTNGRVRLWPPLSNYSQALHQKFIVVDDEQAVVGGLDIDERRYDDLAHRRHGHQTWHDVSVAVGGKEAKALSQHFDNSWRQVKQNGRSYAEQFLRERPTSNLKFESAEHNIPWFGGPQRTAEVDSVVTTKGHAREALLNYGPARFDRSIEAAHFDLIQRAEKIIYIETQYFRSSAIRDAVIARLGQKPDLHVIALLPGAPDVVAYEGDFSAVHRYGEWLQMRALDQLTKLFPNRFAAYCLTNDLDRTEEAERDALYGKAMVYIHSKVMLADDEAAIVSSANLNARSLEWDFEAGIYFRDRKFSRDLRQQLWHAHLGELAAQVSDCDDSEACFELWKNAADARRKAGRDTAGVGIVPFPIGRVKRFSKRHMLIPQQMV